jgi:hypothetical protein
VRTVNSAKSINSAIHHQLASGLAIDEAVAETRRVWLEEFSSPGGRSRDIRVFCLIDQTGKFAGVAAFSRPEIGQPDTIVAVSSSENGTTEHPREQLPQLLSQPGLKAVPIS